MSPRPPESLGHLFPMGYPLEFFTKREMGFQKMTSHLICTSLGSKYNDPNFTENKTEGKLSLSGGKGWVLDPDFGNHLGSLCFEFWLCLVSKVGLLFSPSFPFLGVGHSDRLHPVEMMYGQDHCLSELNLGNLHFHENITGEIMLHSHMVKRVGRLFKALI